MTTRSPNPHLIGTTGPAAVLPARVCRVLEHELGRELATLRTRARGVDQEVAYALIALATAAATYVPPEEQMVAESSEQAAESRHPQEWVSATRAAELLGVGSRAVVQAIARGRLPATRIGREWRLLSTDVENYRNARVA